MRFRDVGNALVIALISILLMVGALSISLVEFVPEVTPTSTNMVPPSPLPLTVTITLPPTTTPLILESPTASLTSTSTITATPPSSCAVPLGWGQTIVYNGDTLDNIAVRYRISKDQLRAGNCLLSDNLVLGSVLYVPPVATNTAVLCYPGAAGWANTYIVKSGDTFYKIAQNYYTKADTIKSVNCRTSDYIYTGETLWVPLVAATRAAPSPYPTTLPGDTAIPYPTDPITETPLPYTVTPVPSPTPEPPATPTPVPTLTASPTAFPQ